MENYTTSQLEKIVYETSVPYNDSPAFQSALEFIKNVDKAQYKKLLYKEAVDCGAIK